MQKHLNVLSVHYPTMEGETKKLRPFTLFYLMCLTSVFILFVIYELDPSYHVCHSCGKSAESGPGSATSSSGRDQIEEDARRVSGHGGDLKVDGCYIYSNGRFGRTRTEVNATTQSNLDCARRGAQAVVLGVKKCGTETLTAMLDLHPDIVTNIYPVKDDGNMDLNSSTFTRMIPLTTPREIGLLDMIALQYSPGKISRVVESLGEDVKFVLILKDPAQRALSDYRHVSLKMKSAKGKEITKSVKEHVWNYKMNEVKKVKKVVKYFKNYRVADSFERSIFNTSGVIDGSYKLISLGVYDWYVQSILDQIPDHKNLLVLDGQSFVERPWLILREVEQFMGVKSFFARKLFKKEGQYFCPKSTLRPDAGCLKGKGRDKPNVDKKVMKMLARFYEPHTEQLRDMIGLNFSWIPDAEE